MPVQWGLGLAPDVGGNALAAFERGREMKKQEQGQNALAAYATNPSDATLNGLAQFQPEFVIAQRQKMQQQHAAEQEKQLIGAALNGDPNARRQLAYVNSEMYLKLDENHKKAVDGLMQNIGQTAFKILQLPPQQQGPALDQALAGLQAQGIDTSQFQRTGNAEQDLRTALAITGQLDDFEKFAQPKYVPYGEGGMQGFQFGQPIAGGNMQSPQQQAPAQGGGGEFTFEQYQGAVNGLGAQGAAQWAQKNGIKVRVNTPQEAGSLPPGTHYVTPDGQEMIR